MSHPTATHVRPLHSAAVTFVVLAAGMISPAAQGYWVDGSGYYGLRGATETAPAFARDRGTFQAAEQTFRLLGEARANDHLSLHLQLGIFDDPRAAYLGDRAQPRECNSSSGKGAATGSGCENLHQSTGEPGYKSYTPKITKAYVRYAFDYCIVEAGRRGRSWGLGMFLDGGDKPFATDASLFDGVSCDINIQKSQTLGFTVGYDKLAETGAPVDPNWRTTAPATADRVFGANDPGDDLDQFMFSIQYDDRKANAGAPFTKHIGVYFAQISSANYKTADKTPPPGTPNPKTLTKEEGGDNTDLKFLDLYTGFYLGDLALKNEILFRMGKSKDPNWQRLGGQRYDDNGDPATNRLDAIAFAGTLEWTLARGGANIGPTEFHRGDASRHLLFFNYAYAPGDSDGYKNDQGVNSSDQAIKPIADKLSRNSRRSRATAIALHRNFKPALLLFNGRPDSDDLVVDGSFNPSRMVNATLFATGYRFESTVSGTFEARLITANLNEVPGSEVKAYYGAIANSAIDDGSRPAGFFGKTLGYELDLSYNYRLGRDAELGIAGAAALPGKAWQVRSDAKPVNDFLIQSTAVFHF